MACHVRRGRGTREAKRIVLGSEAGREAESGPMEVQSEGAEVWCEERLKVEAVRAGQAR